MIFNSDNKIHSSEVEPTLLPHIALVAPAQELSELMTILSFFCGPRYPYLPRLTEAVFAVVGRRLLFSSREFEQQENIRLLIHHKQLFSYIDASQLNSAVELLLQPSKYSSDLDVAERTCRLAIRFPEHSNGLLLDMASAAYLGLDGSAALKVSAWYLPLTEGAERQSLIDAWLGSNWLNIKDHELDPSEIAAIATLFEFASDSEFESLSHSLINCVGEQHIAPLNLGITIALLSNKTVANRAEVITIITKSITAAYNSDLPSWCLDLFWSRAGGKGLIFDLPEKQPVTLNVLPSDLAFEDVLRLKFLSKVSAPDVEGLLEEIYYRWGENNSAPRMVNDEESMTIPADQPATPAPASTANSPRSKPNNRGGILGGIGSLIGGIFGDGSSNNESAAKPTMRGVPDEPQQSPRRLQANISLLDPSKGVSQIMTLAFLAGAEHKIELSVGRGGLLIAAGPAISEPVFEEGNQTEELQIRLIHNKQINDGIIQLPRNTSLNSSIWQTSIAVPREAESVDALVVVLHSGRVLQAAKLQGLVVSKLSEADITQTKIEFIVTEVTADISDLGHRQKFDAAIVSDGEVGVAFAGSSIGVRDLKGVDKTIEKMTAKLFKTSEAVTIQGAGGDPTKYQKLLVYLAANGKLLHSVLIKQLMPILDDAQRIQIVSTNPSAMLPLEFVYCGPSPKSNARLCDNWQTALQQGHCPSCEQLPEDERAETICPLHFWALSKIIERHTPAVQNDDGHDFIVGSQDRANRQQLAPLKSAVFAASDNVPEDLVDSTFAALKSAVTSCDDARTWDQWATCVKEKSPSLLVSMPHNALDPILEISTLEIGNGDELRAGEVLPKFVCNELSAVRPIVLLLGCQTALGGPQPFHTFVGEFRHNGAAIVIGTLATVLGEHAAPVVQAIIRELKNPTVAGENTIGDVLLRIRRQMFSQGIVIALAVAAFGDADWALEETET